MKAFAQKQHQPQRQIFLSLTRSSATTPKTDPYRNYILHLQRTIGNLAVQRLLRTPREGREVGTAAARFSHDFTRSPGHAIVYRKMDFTDPKPVLADPIPLALSGNILGSTLPGFNGALLPKTALKKDYKEAVFKVLQPQTFNFSAAQNGKTCKVDADKFNVNVIAEVRAITAPQKEGWSGSYSPAMLTNAPSVCAKAKDKIQIAMEGRPDSIALYKKVLAHEQEHIVDLKNLSAQKLKPYHDFLIGLTGRGKTDEDCVNHIFRQVADRDALAAKEFVDQWLDAVQVYDKKGGPHHSAFATKMDPQCTTMQITEKV